ncbi:MAG: hypothetical protein KBA26_12730, partial [Candidatus Delongbacteria bacterium]|nr:hypothetical protein [Candidatus Delongbacteria bacterium]
ISIRILQQHLLDTGCRLMPFIDTQPDDPYFHAIQTCGLRGILRGRGEPHQWANRTWFYPDQAVTPEELLQAVMVIRNQKIQADPVSDQSAPPASLGRACSLLRAILIDPGCDIRQTDSGTASSIQEDWDWIIQRGAMPPEAQHQIPCSPLRRKDLAWMVDHLVPLA